MPQFDLGDRLITQLVDLGWKFPGSRAQAYTAVVNRFSQITSITDYGADPTGAADSTAAINAAIAALGTNSILQFPAGTFLINSALNAIPANCIVAGVGEYATQINTPLASGTLFTFTGANSSLYNLTITDTAAGNTAQAVNFNAAQLTAQNLAITGFGNTTASFNLTSSVTFGNIYNLFIASTIANAVGLNVAGSDTTVQGCQFNGTGSATFMGMACAATDRFAVSDCVFKSNNIGISFTNTASTGSTAVAGCTFDASTTAVSIAPGTGNVVANLALVGFSIDGATTGISVAPTGSGTVTTIDMDGTFFNCTTAISAVPAGTSTIQGLDFDGTINACTTGVTLGGSTTGTCSDVDLDALVIAFTTGVQFTQSAGPWNNVILGECVFDTTVGSATAISFAPTSTGTSNNITIDGCILALSGATSNGLTLAGPASSLAYMTVDATQFIVTGTGFNASAASFGGAQTSKPVTLVNCPFNCTTASNPAIGATNTQPFVFRGCFGANPAGKTTNQPATAATTTNNLGCDVFVAIAGTGATTVLIGGQATGITLANGVFTTIRVPYGQTWGFGTPANATQVVFGD